MEADHYRLAYIGLFAFIFASAAMTLPASAQTTNLILNGGFEDGKQAWSTGEAHNPHLVNVDSNIFVEGNCSLLLDGAAASNRFVDAIQFSLKLKPATRYLFCADIRRSAVASGFVAATVLEKREPDSKAMSHNIGVSGKAGPNIWEHFEEEFTAGDKVTEAMAILYNKTDGKIWFDNVALYDLSRGRPSRGQAKVARDKDFGAEVFSVKRADEPIKIDGIPDEKSWQKADTGVDFQLYDVQCRFPIKVMDQTSFKLLYDDQYLYLFAVCHESNMNNLKKGALRDGKIWNEDCLEFFISKTSPDLEYVHFAINSDGQYYDGAKTKNGKYDSVWNAECKISATKEKDRWSIEAAIPLPALGIVPGKETEFALNMTRNDEADGKVLSTWSPLPPSAGGFHAPEYFGAAKITGDIVPARHISLLSRSAVGGILANPAFEPDNRNSSVPSRWTMETPGVWTENKPFISSVKAGNVASQAMSLSGVAGKKINLSAYLHNSADNGRVMFEYTDNKGNKREFMVNLPVTEKGFHYRTLAVTFPIDVAEVTRGRLKAEDSNLFEAAFLQMQEPLIMNFIYKVPLYGALPTNSAYFSPSIPVVGVSRELVTPLMWTANQTFTTNWIWGTTAADDNGKPLDKNFTVFIDLPDGVEIKRCGGNYSNPDQFSLQKGHTVEAVERDGRKFKRHCFALGGLGTGVGVTYCITTLPAGERRDGYSWLEWKGGRAPEDKITFVSVELPEVMPPKRFVTGVSLGCTLLEKTMPPEDEWTFARWRKLGFNQIVLHRWNSNMWPDKEKTPVTDRFIQGLKQAGLMVAVLTSGSPDFSSKKEPEGTAYDPSGKPLENDMCLSYRGKAYQSNLDFIRTIAAHGISWVIFDWEDYNYRADQVCFCPRCKDQFKQFLQKKYPAVEYADPAVVAKDGNRAELMNAWSDFKNTLVEQWLTESKAVLVENAGKSSTLSSPKPYLDLCESSFEWDWPRMLKGPVDHAGIMRYAYYDFYTEPSVRSVGEAIYRDFNDFGSKKGAMIPVLSPGERDGRMVFPREGMKYQILESAVSGSAGFLMYYYELMDAAALKYVAEAVRMIAPVEDIILDGDIAAVPSLNKAVKIKRIIHPQKGTVVFVSEYSFGKVDVNWKETVGKKCEMTDLDSGEVVARLKPGENRMTVTLDRERARLFYIGDRNKLDFGSRQRQASGWLRRLLRVFRID